MVEETDKLFKEAIRLRDLELYEDALDSLNQVLKVYQESTAPANVYLVMGGIYSDLERHQDAIDSFKKVQAVKPDSELASLGIYLSLAKLEKYDAAIREMDQFLFFHSADSYLITLEELNEDLKNGYARDHEATIVRLSRKFGLYK